MGLQGAGGCLHSKAATYKALRSMLASLGDPYTEFLWPSQVHASLNLSSADQCISTYSLSMAAACMCACRAAAGSAPL